MKTQFLPKALMPWWIVRAFNKEDAKEIFEQRCSLCSRSFLEFMLEDERKCPACEEPFSSFLGFLREQKERLEAGRVQEAA